MKRTFGLIALALALLMLVSACKPSAKADVITGNAKEALEALNEKAGESEVSTMEEDMTKENCATLGLSEATFTECVDSGVISVAMISSVAHMTAMVKCKDAESAVLVRNEIAENFDMLRWVCVTPEKAYAVDGGSYVFFAATFEAEADRLYEAFKAIAGDSLGETSEIVAD